MSRPSEPYLWRDPKTGHVYIGARYTDAIGGQGPLAEVWVDDVWLRIKTDKYKESNKISEEAIDCWRYMYGSGHR